MVDDTESMWRDRAIAAERRADVAEAWARELSARLDTAAALATTLSELLRHPDGVDAPKLSVALRVVAEGDGVRSSAAG